LGSEARMNTPSLDGGNWRWRFHENQLDGTQAAKLAQLVELSDRVPQAHDASGCDKFFA
jgi:4-alpha-glucanotransferase